MSDWYPAIRECSIYWQRADMMQQTYEALESTFSEDNDACIDCAKSMIEVVCRAILSELDNPDQPVSPKEDTPSFGAWVSSATRALKLGDNRNTAFQKLVSQHHKLTTTLGDLRNEAGPVSHGKDAFIGRLSAYHRRAAVLSADAIVAFLHHAYLEFEPNLARTKEPYERFNVQNELIDGVIVLSAEAEDNGGIIVTANLPDGEQFTITTSASRFLFHIDRSAYIEALNSARSLPAALENGMIEDLGEPA